MAALSSSLKGTVKETTSVIDWSIGNFQMRLTGLTMYELVEIKS